MSHWAPYKRQEFIGRLRNLGFAGPFAGSRHQFMIKDEHRLAISSNAEYSVAQLRMMLKEVGMILGREISSEEWNAL